MQVMIQVEVFSPCRQRQQGPPKRWF